MFASLARLGGETEPPDRGCCTIITRGKLAAARLGVAWLGVVWLGVKYWSGTRDDHRRTHGGWAWGAPTSGDSR